MTRELTEAARCAALIRKTLKGWGIAAHVRSSNFSMGDSVDVHLLDDPRPEVVERAESFCKGLQDGHFDGMTDSYEYAHHDDGLPRAKYVMVQVEYSDTLREEARAYLQECLGDADANKIDRELYRCLAGSFGHFWDECKASGESMA